MTAEQAAAIQALSWWTGLAAADICEFQLGDDIDRLVITGSTLRNRLGTLFGRTVTTAELSNLQALRDEFRTKVRAIRVFKARVKALSASLQTSVWAALGHSLDNPGCRDG